LILAKRKIANKYVRKMEITNVDMKSNLNDSTIAKTSKKRRIRLNVNNN
jgi:hypothetical protein